MILTKGTRKPVNANNVTLKFKNHPQHTDHAIFVSNKDKKLINDNYMIFYGQPETPCQSINYNASQDSYYIDFSKLPPEADKITLTFSTEDGYNGDLSFLPEVNIDIGEDSLTFSKSDIVKEKALMLVEFYKHNNQWKSWTIIQGFNGGLADLVRFFGADVAPKNSEPEIVKTTNITLNKTNERLIKLEKTVSNPSIINLAKTIHNLLPLYNLENHTADVALIIDFSVSMTPVFKNGFIQKITDRLMAAGILFDDNASIDVFLFDHRTQYLGEITVKNFENKIAEWEQQYKLGHDTKYGGAIKEVMEFYFQTTKKPEQAPLRDKPVYAFFVTDGDATDKQLTTRLMREVSYYPIFWQFVGVHTGMFSSFAYLERLDDLKDRCIDNADFFEINKKEINSMTDKELLDRMFNEYPSWLKMAKQYELIK